MSTMEWVLQVIGLWAETVSAVAMVAMLWLWFDPNVIPEGSVPQAMAWCVGSAMVAATLRWLNRRDDELEG